MAIARRSFLRAMGAAAVGLSAQPLATSCARPGPRRRPNVLFISIDDLNDWIEPLGGHSQAITPNLARFARRSVNFRRSYCASPSCLPSRTALLTGLHSYTSGVYSNYQYWREALPDAETLPQYFMGQGYRAAGAGKIFHNDQADPRSWDAYFPSKERHMPANPRPTRTGTVGMPAFEDMYGAFDWAAVDVPDEEMGDFKSVSWVADQLQEAGDQALFLACGIYRPHLPWYVPRRYFEMFPLESLRLPRVLENDLDDVGDRAREIAYRAGGPDGYHGHVGRAGQWSQAVQGYLASIAFADAQLGRLLDALDASPHRDNTVVVLFSDHGWQLGEKEHWRKFALWENTVRTVNMISVPAGAPGLPGGSADGATCDRVVSLVDLYPTLLDVCGLPPKPGLDGRSLARLLRDPGAAWDHPALTTYDFSEFSVRTEGWRYTRYIDDSEELYDEENDPEEWTNLAGDPEYGAQKASLVAHIPQNQAPLAETSYELMPHHIPPFRSKAEYRAFRDRVGQGAASDEHPGFGPWLLPPRPR
jgi:arylsulfatase A-like enzyme